MSAAGATNAQTEHAANAEQSPAELATPAPPPQGLTVLVCGDRAWSDGFLILRTLQGIPGIARVIHGGCRGSDLLGGWAARRLGIAVEVFTADWAREGRAAGPRRNERMLQEGHPDLVLAFHDDLNQSLGTRDTLIRATQARIPFRVVSHVRPEGTGSKALASLDAYAGRRVEVRADSPQPKVAPVQVLGSSSGLGAPRDARRTRSEARLAYRTPLVGGEDGVDDRRFSVLEVTSGLPDDSRDQDQRARARVERQRQGRVKAARAALEAHPEARDVVLHDQTRLRMFCARFGVTPQDLCPHAETDGARIVHPGSPRNGMCGWCSGRHGWQPIHVADVQEVVASPLDWMSEVRAREDACLPGTDA